MYLPLLHFVIYRSLIHVKHLWKTSTSRSEFSYCVRKYKSLFDPIFVCRRDNIKQLQFGLWTLSLFHIRTLHICYGVFGYTLLSYNLLVCRFSFLGYICTKVIYIISDGLYDWLSVTCRFLLHIKHRCVVTNTELFLKEMDFHDESECFSENLKQLHLFLTNTNLVSHLNSLHL